MKHRKTQSAVLWSATAGGIVFGMAMNTVVGTVVISHPSVTGESVIGLFIIAIFAGGGVCGGLAWRWAERWLKGRE